MIEKLKFWMFRLLNNVRCWIALKPYAKATLTIGLGDVLLNRRELMTIQMIVAARLLDVEKFFKDGDYSSYYSLSLSRYSGSKAPASVQQEHNARFKRLMESIRTEGYDPKSAICVNRDFVMFNGTHRIATVLHLNYDSIVADIFKKSALTLNTWESWRRPFTFPDEFLNKLYKKNDYIQNQLVKSGNCFILWTDKPLSAIDEAWLTERAVVADRKTLSGNVEFEGHKLTAGCLYYLALREPDYTIQNRQLHSRRTDSIAQQLQSSGYETYITENCLKGTLLHRAAMAVA